MKRIFTTIFSLLTISTLIAQPVLYSDSLHTGLSFNLYSLSNVNIANITPSGANVTWDLSSTAATLAGTADFQEMSETPYALDYPAANFAMKFTIAEGPSIYSLFNLSNSVLEEVANNVGTANPVTFTNYRTSLIFPFSFGLFTMDVYQKAGQNVKSISINYDGFGTFITNDTSYENVVRIYNEDDGNTNVTWWSTTPLSPLFQASSGGYILWKLTSSSVGIAEMYTNHIFDMYPNPAMNELHIINKELISMVEIFNISGQLQLSTTRSTIDISSLQKGWYLLTVTTQKGESITQKFIKN